MILTKKITIKINNRYVKYYKELGYTDIKGGDEIEINVDELPKQSHQKVECGCDVCGSIQIIKYYNYVKNIKNQGFYTCKKCKHIKTETTNIKKYGVKSTLQSKEVIEQIEKINLERHGVKHYSQSEEYNSKIKTINQQKYGVDYFFQSKEYMVSKEDIFMEKYGVKYYSQTDDFNEKKEKTTLKKYGVKHYSQTKEFRKQINNIKINNFIEKGINIISINKDEIIISCKKGHEYTIHKDLLKNRLRFNVEPCLICNPINFHQSDKENKLYKFIKENYDGEIILSNREILNGKELDIYLPELELAFEFNGVYWHNELFKENKYHLQKTEMCVEQGIQLIHVWEDDWVYKQDIVKSMILNKIGFIKNKIYGRKTEIKEISDNKLIREFLDKNHLQGFVGSKIKIGLFHNNELVSLMTFGKKRKIMNSKSKDGEYELLRFCNKLNTNVIGGASKLFNYFENEIKYSEITTYADRSHSQGNLYNVLGFDFVHKTTPNYFYIINGIRKHRFGFRKDVLIKEGYDKNMTEHEIMFGRKIFRIYDSGSLKYRKTSN